MTNRYIPKDNKNINKDASIEYHYYLIGDNPFRIKYIAPYIPTKAEILNCVTKEFEIDNTYISRAETNLDIINITEKEFINACLQKGAKPPEKD